MAALLKVTGQLSRWPGGAVRWPACVALLDPQPDGVPGPAQNAGLRHGFEHHQRQAGDLGAAGGTHLQGAHVLAFITLGFGAIIVSSHNVWSGLPAVLTVMGWAQVLKGALYFIFPSVGLKILGRVSPDKAHHFVIGGVALLLGPAALLGWHLLR